MPYVLDEWQLRCHNRHGRLLLDISPLLSEEPAFYANSTAHVI